MSGMGSGPAMMAPTLAGWVVMMAAMMLPSAVPAIAGRARSAGNLFAAPRFAGVYLLVWVAVACLISLVYVPVSPVVAGAIVVAAGLYELTPAKQWCRRQCREQLRSGAWFGVCCLGSSLVLMLAMVALDAMSVALMALTALIVLAQKLLAPRPAFDVPLALMIVAAGLVIAIS